MSRGVSGENAPPSPPGAVITPARRLQMLVIPSFKQPSSIVSAALTDVTSPFYLNIIIY